MIMGDVPFSNEVEIVRAELNFSDDVSKGKRRKRVVEITILGGKIIVVVHEKEKKKGIYEGK